MSKEFVVLDKYNIRVEIIESEEKITVGPHPQMQPSSVTMTYIIITFILGQLTTSFLSEAGKDLWVQLKKVFSKRKEKYTKQKDIIDEVVKGVFIFNCNSTKIECVFEVLEKIHIDTLHLLVKFIKDNPQIKDVKFFTQGPIQYMENDVVKKIRWSELKNMYPE